MLTIFKFFSLNNGDLVLVTDAIEREQFFYDMVLCNFIDCAQSVI